MTFSDKIKQINRTIARHGMFFSAWLFETLPYPIVKAIMKGLLWVAYVFAFKQKRIARESLKIAFGKEMTDAQIEKLVVNNFQNLGHGMIEMFYYMQNPEKVASKVVFKNKERLDMALKEGKGVIAVTAHFGNFPLMMLHCAQLGYKTNCIIRPTRDPAVEDFLMKKRNHCGLKTIYAVPRHRSVVQSLQALRNNEIVFIPLDQNFGSGSGVFVDFFGQKAATATGPVVMAQRTQAAIVPMFIIRSNADEHIIFVENPIDIKQGKDEEDTLLINTAHITHLIEQYIRRYPHEWGWMHRRWKSRPKEEATLMPA